LLMAEDSSITGFNIGMNCGEDSGQTVFHCHVHLIPRRKFELLLKLRLFSMSSHCGKLGNLS
jgi:diadenosine tetraphosphate (Ap4A) HIT family hydrolase